MKFIVVGAQTFEGSVVDILSDLGAASPSYAARVGNDVRTAMATLDENPRRGRVIPEMNDERMRELLITNRAFRVMYLVDVESRIVRLVDFQRAQRFAPSNLAAIAKLYT